MEQIYTNLYVGNDLDYEKIKDNPDWKSVRVCKYGPGGHKETLGYNTPGAPKGKNYLHIEAKNRMAINILDLDDPHLIPLECIKIAIDYTRKQLENGKKVLIACNQGHSRGPSTGLAFLRAIGDMPHNFQTAERIYRTLYPNYQPGMGMRHVIKSNWSELEGM